MRDVCSSQYALCNHLGGIPLLGRADRRARVKDFAPKPGHRTPLAGEDPSEFRGCSRKKRYTTRLEARKAADAVSKRKDAPRLYVYQCPYCSGWHLTHRRKGN